MPTLRFVRRASSSEQGGAGGTGNQGWAALRTLAPGMWVSADMCLCLSIHTRWGICKHSHVFQKCMNMNWPRGACDGDVCVCGGAHLQE